MMTGKTEAGKKKQRAQRLRSRTADKAAPQCLAQIPPPSLGRDVVALVSIAAHCPAAQIQANYVLVDAPLLIDPPHLRTLTAMLQRYLASHQAPRQLSLAEVLTSGLTVGGLVQVVAAKFS
jgi:hypothetical protein